MARLLALDPALRHTGWVVADISRSELCAAGQIVTAKAPAKERLTVAADGIRRGLLIARAIKHLIESYGPTLVAMEAGAGSLSAKAATGMARAQQACADAIDSALGSLPIIVSPWDAKIAACGKANATKAEVQAAMVARWPGGWGAFMDPIPVGQREHIYDAAAVAHAVWDRPAVAALRGG